MVTSQANYPEVFTIPIDLVFTSEHLAHDSEHVVRIQNTDFGVSSIVMETGSKSVRKLAVCNRIISTIDYDASFATPACRGRKSFLSWVSFISCDSCALSVRACLKRASPPGQGW
ncbi:hypothetical protein SAMN04488109_1138 [Chryseolinea serpens]|uniref:Uncharacterized protein n=1 Tax=Chryseolinea serpens TaxID=947013 RepID=A0A1M5LCQ3_9BACT|nr:hypothetical protein SAMN04488109_1138 [Chryseolinea serpens]